MAKVALKIDTDNDFVISATIEGLGYRAGFQLCVGRRRQDKSYQELEGGTTLDLSADEFKEIERDEVEVEEID